MEKNLSLIKIKFIIIVVMLLISCMTTNTVKAEISKMTGDKEEKCNISFEVRDETRSFNGEIKVIMKDVTNTVTEEYLLTKSNSWGSTNIPNYTVKAPTTYNIQFKGIEEGYKLINQDGTEIKNFAATKKGYKFHWKIVENDKEIENNNFGIIDITSTEDNRTMDTDDVEKEIKIKENISKEKEVKNTYEDAEEVFKKFLDTISFIRDSPEWNEGNLSFLYEYERNADNKSISYAQDFKTFVHNGTKEEYMQMSLFDRFVYEETYVRLAKYLNFGNWERYFETKENFTKNVTNEVYNRIRITDKENETGIIVAEAYLELMDWQYNYIKDNKAPYDFVKKLNYFQSKTKVENTSEITKETAQKEGNDLQKQNTQEKKSVWNETFNKVKDNIIGIVIIIFLLLILIGVIYLKRKNNISNDKNVK